MVAKVSPDLGDAGRYPWANAGRWLGDGIALRKVQGLREESGGWAMRAMVLTFSSREKIIPGKKRDHSWLRPLLVSITRHAPQTPTTAENPVIYKVRRRKGPGGPTGLQNRLGGHCVRRKVRLLPPSAIIPRLPSRELRRSVTSTRKRHPIQFLKTKSRRDSSSAGLQLWSPH